MTPAADAVTTVSVGGQRLRVAVRPGAGDGPPLLVCNGIGTPLEALAPFTGALDRAITVVRFDVPGTGGSPPTRLPYSVPWLALVAGRMMTALGHGRFDVLGISWGGGLAQQLALSYPRRCRRLVLAATSTGSLMVPAAPRVLLYLSSPRGSPAPSTAAPCGASPSSPRRSPGPTRRPPRGAVTCTSSSPRPAGPACRGCGSSGSRR
jgi:pimeloyl-ACP methyl ester carboxylesterase